MAWPNDFRITGTVFFVSASMDLLYEKLNINGCALKDKYGIITSHWVRYNEYIAKYSVNMCTWKWNGPFNHFPHYVLCILKSTWNKNVFEKLTVSLYLQCNIARRQDWITLYKKENSISLIFRLFVISIFFSKCP